MSTIEVISVVSDRWVGVKLGPHLTAGAGGCVCHWSVIQLLGWALFITCCIPGCHVAPATKPWWNWASKMRIGHCSRSTLTNIINSIQNAQLKWPFIFSLIKIQLLWTIYKLHNIQSLAPQKQFKQTSSIKNKVFHGPRARPCGAFVAQEAKPKTWERPHGSTVRWKPEQRPFSIKMYKVSYVMLCI